MTPPTFFGIITGCALGNATIEATRGHYGVCSVFLTAAFVSLALAAFFIARGTK